jgi:hypothetical protein
MTSTRLLRSVMGRRGTPSTSGVARRRRLAVVRWSRRQTLLGFGSLRFPFTFLGVMALGIALWVVVYLGGHPNMDPVARGIAAATVLLCLAFGTYVLIRRVRRGPHH